MQPIITLDNVTAGYDGRPQISGISMTIHGHDFIAVTGPNGSGKTTLMRVVLGLIAPIEGTVSYQPDGLKPRFGYLPQYNAIDRDFPINVHDTVLSGLNGSKPVFSRTTRADREAAGRTIERLGLADIAQRPIHDLSGGQLQRTLLARAIVSQPDVLVLDEPTTYIDKDSWQQTGNIITGMRRQCAIILVSHDADFIQRLCPTMLLRMEGGRIITKDRQSE